MLISIVEVYELCTVINDTVTLLEQQPDLTAEAISVLESFGDGTESNDLEIVLNDISQSLQYMEYDPEAESLSSLTYISKRLDTIDARLDTEFIAFNDGFNLLLGAVMFSVVWTLLKTVFHRLENA